MRRKNAQRCAVQRQMTPMDGRKRNLIGNPAIKVDCLLGWVLILRTGIIGCYLH